MTRRGSRTGVVLSALAAVAACGLFAAGAEHPDIIPQAFAQQQFKLEPVFYSQIYGQTNQNSDEFILYKRSSDVLFHTIGGTNYLLQTGQQHGHLVILNVANPASPSVVSSVFDQQATKAIAGSIRAPLMAGAVGVEVVTINGRLYAAVIGAFNNDALQMLDITDPANVAVSGNSGQRLHNNQPWSEVSGVDIIQFDNKVYAVVTDRYRDSLTMIDITDPSSPSIVGGVLNGQRGANLNNVRDVSTLIINNVPYAVTVSSSGPPRLQVVNLTNAASPSGVANYNAGTLVGVDTAFIGGKPYAVTSDWGTGRVDIIDLTNPASPTRVGTMTSSTNNIQVVDIFTAGSTTYVAVGGENGIQVIDITNPANPAPVASRDKGWPLPLEHVIGIDGTVVGGVPYIATAATLATPEGTSIFRMVPAVGPTITSPSGQNGDTVAANQLRFSVSFDRPVTGFDASDIQVSGSARTTPLPGADTKVSSFSGSGSGPYTFVIYPETAGSVTVTIPEDAPGVTPQNSAASFTLIVRQATPGPGEIVDNWSSTLTVHDLGNSRFGCDDSNSDASKRCDAALTRDEIHILRPPGFLYAPDIDHLYLDKSNNSTHFSITTYSFSELVDYHFRVGTTHFNFGPFIEFGRHSWSDVRTMAYWDQGTRVSLELIEKSSPAPATGTPPKLSFFSVSPTTMTEGAPGSGFAVRINLAQPAPTGGVDVCITTEPRGHNDPTGRTDDTGGSDTFAKNQVDYIMSFTTITVPAGQRTATDYITIIEDDIVERDEIFNVVACSIPEEAFPASGADLYQVGSVKVTIRDND